MKKVYYHFARSCPAYPNGADTNYYKKKLEDILTGIASGFGLMISIVVLMRLV